MNHTKHFYLMNDLIELERILYDFANSKEGFSSKMETLKNNYPNREFKDKIEALLNIEVEIEYNRVLAELKENLAQHSPDETV